MGNVLASEQSEIQAWFPSWPILIEHFPRYRAVTVGADEPLVVIRTRTGGGNRMEYEEANEKLRKLEGYEKDEDDDFDSTYAYWFYRIPAQSLDGWRQYCERMRTRDEDTQVAAWFGKDMPSPADEKK